MYLFPKSVVGKWSFWVGVTAFILMFLQYWLAMLLQTSFILPGILVIVCLLGAGVGAVVALLKYKDNAFLLYLATLLGCFGLFLIVGELLFPH